jgi:hypothetical protein
MSAHVYWRIYILNDNGGSNVCIGDMQLRATVGGADQAYGSGGTASASTALGGYPASAAFDNNPSNWWVSNAQVNGAWLEYQFPSAVSVAEYTVSSRNDGPTYQSNSPLTWYLQYSDDGTTWTNADYQTGQTSWGSGDVRTFTTGHLSAIAIDTSVGYNTTNTNTATVSVSTNFYNELICLLAFAELAAGAPAISSVSGGGLTWTKQKVSNGSGKSSLEFWTAVAASPLTSQNITVTYASNYDDAVLWIGGFVGPVSPYFDPNASVPAVASYTTTATPSFSGISTNNADDYLIFAWGSNAAAAFGTAPSGMAQIGSVQNGGGSLWAYMQIAAMQVSSPQSSQTYTWGSSVGGSGIESMLIALTSDGGTPTPPAPGTRRTVLLMG